MSNLINLVNIFAFPCYLQITYYWWHRISQWLQLLTELSTNEYSVFVSLGLDLFSLWFRYLAWLIFGFSLLGVSFLERALYGIWCYLLDSWWLTELILYMRRPYYTMVRNANATKNRVNVLFVCVCLKFEQNPSGD